MTPIELLFDFHLNGSMHLDSTTHAVFLADGKSPWVPGSTNKSTNPEDIKPAPVIQECVFFLNNPLLRLLSVTWHFLLLKHKNTYYMVRSCRLSTCTKGRLIANSLTLTKSRTRWSPAGCGAPRVVMIKGREPVGAALSFRLSGSIKGSSTCSR